MRLKTFLNESSFCTKITDDEKILKILNTKCAKNWKHIKDRGSIEYMKIWRGDPELDDDKVYLFEGKSTRKSANTTNYYTLMFSEILPSWKNIPKRNKALICSTEQATAQTYSGDNNSFLVVPYDSTIIAQANEADFWNITENEYDFGLPYINDSLRYFRCKRKHKQY